MDFLRLFADQERHGFPDLAGSSGEGSIHVSERLLNGIIADQLEGSASIKSLHVTPHAGDRFSVRASVAKASFLPPISIEVVVEKQPSLPGDPVMVLGMSGLGGLLRFAGAFLKSLPPGVRMEGERVFIDIRAALAAKGLTSVLNYLEAVRVNSEEGRVIVSFKVRAGG